MESHEKAHELLLSPTSDATNKSSELRDQLSAKPYSVANSLQRGRKSKSKSRFQIPLPVTLALAAAFRIALFSSGSVSSVLERRPELATPLTSIRSLREGVYLCAHGANPYDGGVFYHSPLYLGLFTILDPISVPLTALLWTVTDIGAACGLVSIARSRTLTTTRDSLVAAVYLLNPYTILSCLARSTTSFDNALIVLSIACIAQDSNVLALSLLAAAAHTSLYPILLLPAFLMLIASRCPSRKLAAVTAHAMAFTAMFGVGVVAAYAMIGDWSWTSNTWGTILTLSDLTPNVGVWWYFFTEMFDHFRPFFIGVFQLHLVIYVAPLCIRLNHDPLFAILVLLGVIGTLKSYPALGDTALWAGLLACFPEVVSNLRHPLVTITTHLYTLLLLPLLHSLWLLTGTGNANFFYAATLVYAVANGMGVIDILGAGLKAQVKSEAREKMSLGESEEEWEKRGLVAVQYTGIGD